MRRRRGAALLQLPLLASLRLERSYPARPRRGKQRLGELRSRGAPRLQLLGLRRKAAGLWTQLPEQVAQPFQVCLRLGQLGLRLAAAAVVAADPGRLLEQRPALFGAQRQRLVDHALADEQERVVGDVAASSSSTRSRSLMR